MDAGCRVLPAKGSKDGLRARFALFLVVVATLASAHVGAATVSSPEHWKSVALGKGVAASFPDDWPVHPDGSDIWRGVHSGRNGRFDAVMLVHVELRRTHDDALKRLAQIEFKHVDRAQYALVGGWPGFERKVRVPYIEPGESDRGGTSAGSDRGSLRVRACRALGLPSQLGRRANSFGDVDRTPSLREAANDRPIRARTRRGLACQYQALGSASGRRFFVCWKRRS